MTFVARVCALAILGCRRIGFAIFTLRITVSPRIPRKPGIGHGEAGKIPLGNIWYISGIPCRRGHLRTLFMNATGRCSDAFVPPKGRGKVLWPRRAR